MTRLKVPILDPSYVFNTPVTAQELPGHHLKDVPGSYDRENPALQSFKLYVFPKPGTHVVSGYVQATLLLTSSIKLPFLIELEDLELYIDGHKTSFSYLNYWNNNACTIQFAAPVFGGQHTGTLATSYPVDLSSSAFNFTVSGAPAACALIGTPWTPTDSMDVTILKVQAEPVINILGQTISTNTLKNVSSFVEDGSQTYSLAAPQTSTVITPAWFSFGIEAYHPNFSNITCDLSFTDATGNEVWSIPVHLPTPVNNLININVPYSDWDDAYTLLKVLYEDIGWQNGTFKLTWTHLNGDTIPVALVNFTISAADPSVQPVTFTDNSGRPVETIMPVVWVNGVTYLTFWSDTANISEVLAG